MEEETKKANHTRTIILCVIAIIAIVGAMIGYGFYQWDKKQENSRVTPPQPANMNRVQNMNENANERTNTNVNVNTNTACLNDTNLPNDDLTIITMKPIIYLYPEEENEITVKVNKPESLTTTYPKYVDSWKVTAKPDGTLTDSKTGRSLYALYWEGKHIEVPERECGFVVKGEDTASFLEEKLAILGLNEREAQEFIVYWLPQLEKNPYNWIYFETEEEIEENMGLEITPKPDTCIRVMMDWKGLKEAIEVQEQTLKAKERSGYTVVEWGGTELK